MWQSDNVWLRAVLVEIFACGGGGGGLIFAFFMILPSSWKFWFTDLISIVWEVDFV